MTSILLSRLHHPVSNLGYGVRAGIWLQGCTVRCRGCVSVDTWPVLESSRTAIGQILDWLWSLPEDVEGVTISGGEPTDQPESLSVLLHGIRQWADVVDSSRDVLIYTGRSREAAEELVPALRETVDVVISEPFDQALATECGLRGSENQRVHAYSAIGGERYPEDSIDSEYQSQRRQMGVHVDGSRGGQSRFSPVRA